MPLSPADDRDPSQSRLLLVDDKRENLIALEAVLAPLGHHLELAQSGAEALRLLLDDQDFAVVLLDLRMPDMNGLELASMLRSRQATRALPIIFLSAQAPSPADMAEAYRQGAADFLAKPVDTDILRAKVSVFVQLHEQRMQLVRQDELLRRQAVERARAEEASRLKDEFLATVSHELRTPLNAILGWSAMLTGEQPREPAVVEKALSVIHRNAQAQAAIIDDLLDISRIVSGSLRIVPQRLVLDDVVREAIEVVHHAAAAREIELSCHAEHDPCVLIGDPARLRQVVWNLASNAIKFTPRGGRVRLMLARHLDTVKLSVSDTGAGLAPEALPRVFDRFWQADDASRRHGGLGLGLAIVRELVELHGGQIAAESAGLGQGSTFTVTLPVRAVLPSKPEIVRAPFAASTPAEQGSLELAGRRVLVVDDTEDARELLRAVLASMGAVVEAAGSAAAALEVLPAFAPDVLVTDIGMPGEDGHELLRRLRAEQPRFASLPVIALTAYATRDDRRRAEVDGFRRILGKPATMEDLAGAILEATGPALASPHR